MGIGSNSHSIKDCHHEVRHSIKGMQRIIDRVCDMHNFRFMNYDLALHWEAFISALGAWMGRKEVEVYYVVSFGQS